ncbi:RDD family protein [Jeotgalibacillus proteolyticus]|uniref:RDD domain-containing protein n=1 Tax=Jeotgalibacillus proteolyticus TaxID=2082395 RepID=A0A2S5GDQ6_9BACL|nr:RDD family protein [Jeotgalibacillus proteolyticus]PPA71023.1 hypothetical protein C4B60_09605 [Jeotgalibacillus proteolyticus]
MNTTTKHAGFGARLVAFLIDGLLISSPFMLISFFVFGTADIEQVAVLYWPYIVIGTLYFIGMPVTPMQATVGKYVMGMIVTDEQYQPIKLGKSIGRYFSQILSYLIIFIGYLLIAVTKKKTDLHDMIAGTYIIYKG